MQVHAFSPFALERTKTSAETRVIYSEEGAWVQGCTLLRLNWQKLWCLKQSWWDTIRSEVCGALCSTTSVSDAGLNVEELEGVVSDMMRIVFKDEQGVLKSGTRIGHFF